MSKPTGQRWHIHDGNQLNNFVEWVHAQWDQDKKPTFQILTSDRTTSQNSMMYALYGQISAQSDDKSTLDVRRECKLHYGIGILKAGDPAFAAFYDYAIKGMSYENKLLLMGHMEVTSQFGREQASEYIDTILAEYGKQGYQLADPRLA